MLVGGQDQLRAARDTLERRGFFDLCSSLDAIPTVSATAKPAGAGQVIEYDLTGVHSEAEETSGLVNRERQSRHLSIRSQDPGDQIGAAFLGAQHAPRCPTSIRITDS